MMAIDVAVIQFSRLKAARGLPAVLAAGLLTCAPTVVLARTDSRAVSNRDAIESSDSQDILILAADYKPTGTPTEPKKGDQFTYTEQSGATVIAEVLPPSDTEKPFYHWQGGAVYRVHTKVVSRA